MWLDDTSLAGIGDIEIRWMDPERIFRGLVLLEQSYLRLETQCLIYNGFGL